MAKENLVIRDIPPSGKVAFQLYSDFIDPEYSHRIILDAPRCATRMDHVEIGVEYLSKRAIETTLDTSASFKITKIKVASISNKKPKNVYRNIKFFFSNNSGLYQLSNEKIKFATSSNSVLASFNNQEFWTTGNFNPSDSSITIINMPTASFNPASTASSVGNTASVASATNAVVLDTTKIWQRPFRVSIPKSEFINKLVCRENVHDIVIFAYASSNSAIDAKKVTDRYLAGNDPDNTKVDWQGNAANIPTPPPYSKVYSLYNDKYRIIHVQDVPKNKIDYGNIVFWAAIARYTKDENDVWTGKWLQLDEKSNDVYWTKPSQSQPLQGGFYK